MPPRAAPVSCITIDSPVGPLTISATALGVCAVEWRTAHDAADAATGPASAHAHHAATQVQQYFARRRKQFNVPLDLAGATAFRRRVWWELLQIPYGRTVSYSQLADRVGGPGAARAVGQANHHNPIPVIIPCHRVIAADGSLGGFGAGLHVKRFLLELERGGA